MTKAYTSQSMTHSNMRRWAEPEIDQTQARVYVLSVLLHCNT